MNDVKKLIPVELVELALHTLRRFCKQYGVQDRDMAECEVPIIIALREQDRFEWTPQAKKFRRILIIKPQIRNEKWAVAVVFNYERIDQALTDELNASIRDACLGKWDD